MKKIGPVSYYHCVKKRHGINFVSAYLNKFPDASFGWEWGTAATEANPYVHIRLLGLDILRVEPGFVAFLGFWWLRD